MPAPRAVPLRTPASAELKLPVKLPEPPELSQTLESPPADSALADRWARLVNQLADQGDLQALVRELALQAGLHRIDDGTQPPTWHLQVEREMLRSPALQHKLRAAMVTTLGHDVELDVAAGTPTDTPARRLTAELDRRQAAAETLIHNDPVVQQLLAQYKTARIVPGSIKPIATPTEEGRTP